MDMREARKWILCAAENGILQWADERKEEICIYHEASETAPDEFPEGWYADPLHDVVSSFRESEEAQKLVEDAFKENQVDILAFQEDDSFGRYGLDSGRYHQMLKTLEWDEETIWKAVWAYGVQACNRGYVVSEYNNTGLYDIERIEKIGVFADNAEAIATAEKDGVQIIPVEELPEGMPEKLRFYGWVDSPANRIKMLLFS